MSSKIMTWPFGQNSPKTPKMPKQEKVEDVTTITDDANEEQKRTRRKIAQTSGRDSTMLSGIASALKKRLGE